MFGLKTFLHRPLNFSFTVSPRNLYTVMYIKNAAFMGNVTVHGINALKTSGGHLTEDGNWVL